MKKLQRRFAPMAPAAISETGGRSGTKSLAELSEIPKKDTRRLERIYFQQPQDLRNELRVASTADKHQRAILL